MNSEEEQSVVSIIPISTTENTAAPVFNHPEINLLYTNGMRIDHEIIQKILKLPREILIADLEKVLDDSIIRFDYFNSIEWKEETHNFSLHALFLLTELKAEQSLQKVLDQLRQEEEFTEYWYNDFLGECIWECILVLGQNRLNELKNYMLEPDNFLYARGQVSAAVSQLALHYPEKRNEVIQWYNELFECFILRANEMNFEDEDLVEFMVGDVLDFNGKELEVQMERLFEDFEFSGIFYTEWEEVKEELDNPMFSTSKKRKIFTIYNRYTDILSTWHSYGGKYGVHHLDETEGDDFFDEYIESHTPLLKGETKIGRNEPCPCGSGKKYKKCCMDKMENLSIL